MVKFIESELILLKKEIDEMWTLVYNQLDRAGEAVLTLDKELAQQVMVRERRVNAFELKIDSDVEDIIALYNPVAIDLRFVLAMLKINTNLERLGDFAEGIARFVIRCKEPVLDAELMTVCVWVRCMLRYFQCWNWQNVPCMRRVLKWQLPYSAKIICWTKSTHRQRESLPIISLNILKQYIRVWIW